MSISSSPVSADSSRSGELPGSTDFVDFKSIAVMMDAVLAMEPRSLKALLALIWQTSYKLETTPILRAVVACRDPLAENLCQEAMRTMADLEKLANAPPNWKRIETVVRRQAHACALLNACEVEIERARDPKRSRLKAIRGRLEAAAKEEQKRRGVEIGMLATLRQARCPDLWETFETWLEKGDEIGE